MSHFERVFVYGAIALLLFVNGRDLASLALRAERSAMAAAPAAAATELGPAESVRIVSPKGEKDVLLTNRAGRLAWGEAPHDRAYSVAYVFIGKVLNELLQAKEFTEERDELMAELNARNDQFQAQLTDLTERAKALDPGSDGFEAARQEFGELSESYRQWQQEAIARRGKLDAEHIERAYRQLVEAVGVVAERLAIDTVYRFIPTDDEFEADNPDQALLAVRQRTALRYPKELDITDAVIEELSLEVE